jgi:hypothetical protein
MLEEAVANCIRSQSGRGAEFKNALTAIVLSRSSWEAFICEFIEWRRLPADLKEKSFKNLLGGVLHAIAGAPATFDEHSVWAELACVNDLRNELIHHKAQTFDGDASPRDILVRLRGFGVRLNDQQHTWERRCVSPSSATWACKTVARSILELEGVVAGRTRSFRLLRDKISVITSPLDGARRENAQFPRSISATTS